MKALLDYASSKYYSGQPIMSDEEFDKLAEYYGYESVGAPVSGDRIAHAFPMWSLQKVYDDEEIINLPSNEVVKSPKLDGVAIAFYYAYGNLVLALTRGDGKEGLDVTSNAKWLVPDRIDWFKDQPLIQITGEVVAPKTVENARNYAAGALNLKSSEEFSTRNVHFFAYGVNPNQEPNWFDDMLALIDLGFRTVISDVSDEYPIDGVVYRINNYEEFNKLGYTAKHPRGAFALKERKGGVITRLLSVSWQVGRSGVVSPVAELEPVVIGGATISKATLHNIKYIEELDLDIGCLVEVVRAGEIIPRVIKRIYE